MILISKLVFSLTTLGFLALACCASTDQAPVVNMPLNNATTPAQTPASLAPVLPVKITVSPDGQWLGFIDQGNVWLAPIGGGQAKPLTTGNNASQDVIFSADSKHIIYTSDRSGRRAIWVCDLEGNSHRQLTFESYNFEPSASFYNENGKIQVLCSSYLEYNGMRAKRPYIIPFEGGVPTRWHDAYGAYPAASNNGDFFAFVRGNEGFERIGFLGPDSQDIWQWQPSLPVEESFTQRTQQPRNDGHPFLLDNGDMLYLSDRGTGPQIWLLPHGQSEDNATQVTDFAGEIWTFGADKNGDNIVFLHGDTLFAWDTQAGKATPVDIVMPAREPDMPLLFKADKIDECAISPDGNTMAIISKGDVFIRSIEENTSVRQVTHTAAEESLLSWSHDGKFLHFVSDHDGHHALYQTTVSYTLTQAREGDPPNADTNDQPLPWQDALLFSTEVLFAPECHIDRLSLSPDGTQLAYLSAGDIWLINIASNKRTLLHDGWSTQAHWAWHPSGKGMALCTENQNHNMDIFLLKFDDLNNPINLTRHPRNDYNPQWSLDGHYLTFQSNRSGNYALYHIALDPIQDGWTDTERENYYNQQKQVVLALTPSAITLDAESTTNDNPIDDTQDETTDTRPEDQANEAPNDIINPFKDLAWDSAWKRITHITNDCLSHLLHPAGHLIYYNRDNDIFTIDLISGEHIKIGTGQLQSAACNWRRIGILNDNFTQTGIVEEGKIQHLQAYDISWEVSKEAHFTWRFDALARITQETFYDATLRGLDWPLLCQTYCDYAKKAHNYEDFDRILKKFQGHLNASHMGVYSPSENSSNPLPMSVIGARATPAENHSGFVIDIIYENATSQYGSMPLQIGDIITHVDFQPVQFDRSLDAHFTYEPGSKVPVTILRTNKDNETQTLIRMARTVSIKDQHEMRYQAWVNTCRENTHALSDERLGYLHIQNMNETSLEIYERDLYAAASGYEALIIDVRSNSGGWTTDRLLASLTWPQHAYTVPRNGDRNNTEAYPTDRLFIPRYTRPIAVLCNQESFSNAEIFSHAIRNTNRGILVGQQTAGGVISTGMDSLWDGTNIRVPFRGWYTPDGIAQEGNGAMPHIIIPQSPVDEILHRDPQLEAAVQALLTGAEITM